MPDPEAAPRRHSRLAVLVAIAALAVVALAGLGFFLLQDRDSSAPRLGQSRESAARQVTFSYHSEAFDMTRRAIVMLPAGYESDPDRRYPVVYLLHGDPGELMDWPDKVGAAKVEAEAEDKGAPAVILVAADGVAPNGGSAASWANGWVPGDNMESDFVDSLIPAIDQHFRTLADRAHRGIAGLSTGGYGAANLALRHPHLFRISIVLSLDPMVPPPDTFGGDAELQDANNPLLLAQDTPATDASPAFFVGWGTADEGAVPNCEEFVAALEDSGYQVTQDPIPGGHDPAVWSATLGTALIKLGPLLD